VRDHVAKQLVAVAVAARVTAGHDVDFAPRFVLEVPSDDRLELLQCLEQG
jgi:hypothetical protein